MITDSAQKDVRFEEGRDVYNYRCYFCHGYSGDAKTLASTYLTPSPRDFTLLTLDALSRQQMIDAVTHGRPDTAMKGFASLLNEHETGVVVDYVRDAFMKGKELNTLYHIPENGWYDHEQYSVAFPFASGEIAIDTPWEELTPEQQTGRQLFMTSCITCHDRARVNDEGMYWEARAVSYPRAGYSHKDPDHDEITGATPFAKHDVAPNVEGLTDQERQGGRLFQENCAFCHGADGTGKNWIGSFLEQHPRDLTGSSAMSGMTRSRLREVIRDGLPDTTMPAWENVLTVEQIDAISAYISRVFYNLSDDRAPE